MYFVRSPFIFGDSSSKQAQKFKWTKQKSDSWLSLGLQLHCIESGASSPKQTKPKTQTNKQTNKQRNKQTNKQINQQANKQTNEHTNWGSTSVLQLLPSVVSHGTRSIHSGWGWAYDAPVCSGIQANQKFIVLSWWKPNQVWAAYTSLFIHIDGIPLSIRFCLPSSPATCAI